MGQTRRNGTFFFGLTVGLIGALGVIVASDLGWINLMSGNPVQAQTVTAPAPARTIHLQGTLPDGIRVFADGRVLETSAVEGGASISVPVNAARLELRGPDGPLWSTRVRDSLPDTLAPAIGGDVLVELGTQARGGALWLDGTLRGNAPGSVSNVVPGWHVVSVRDGDRVLFEDAVVVRSGEVALITVPPVPPRGKSRASVRARILTPGGYMELPDARVFLDGEELGTVPVEATVSAGFHSLRIEDPEHGTRISVLHLAAGGVRHIIAEFGEESPLDIQVHPPHAATRGPVAVPVVVTRDGESLQDLRGALHLLRGGGETTLEVPLVRSGTDPRVWVAVVPVGSLSGDGPIQGYAACRDETGREGASEIFQLELR